MDCCSTRCFFIRYGRTMFYFRVGDTKMVYGPKEFCLITGFNFGEYHKNIGKKVSEKKKSLLRERLFPNHTNSSVKIGDLKSFVLNHPFLEASDDDAVRVCLIYVLCEGFLGKEINDRVPQDWFFSLRISIFVWGNYLWDFTYDDLDDTWNKIDKYISLAERVSRFTAPFRIWIYEMLPVVRTGGFA
uniref:DUF1985 domain-containing protein n=1 Tax=Lactuca sativa TaxID=4236 RepID=A0A9R1UVY0_LACSA|nr:hypothetical protein LSAT_V11C700345330 [Lactuca sativa]